MSRLGDSPGWPYSKQHITEAIAQSAGQINSPVGQWEMSKFLCGLYYLPPDFLAADRFPSRQSR